MMSDISRQSSPKSSPRGSRSPAYPRQDSTGTLKTTITLGKNPSIFQGGTFYCMKDLPEHSELTGMTNLISYHGLEHSYNKFTGKKLKEELSAFLPNLPGNIDTPGSQDNSSLRSLIEKPPIVGKELIPLSDHTLIGFRLHLGPLPEQFRLLHQPSYRSKHKKQREAKESQIMQENHHENPSADFGTEHRKTKKTKRNDEERKKRKKEKKKKKEKEKEVS